MCINTGAKTDTPFNLFDCLVNGMLGIAGSFHHKPLLTILLTERGWFLFDELFASVYDVFYVTQFSNTW